MTSTAAVASNRRKKVHRDDAHRALTQEDPTTMTKLVGRGISRDTDDSLMASCITQVARAKAQRVHGRRSVSRSEIAAHFEDRDVVSDAEAMAYGGA